MKGNTSMMMQTRVCRLIALTTALSLSAFGQFGAITNKFKKSDSPEKNQLRYEKLKQYAKDKYQKDPDFHDEVEEAYEQLMRDHSQRAYDRNTSISSRIATVREDRWRVHENLYDNLVVQDHVNRIGQKIVPAQSERAMAFKVIPEPTPLAETLATGTVYVSTGLISIVDSEAQLAYILAHEMAHVQLEHWRERVMLDCGQREYADEQAKKQTRLSMIGNLLGAALGSANGLPYQGIGGRLIAANQGAAFGENMADVLGAIIYRPIVVNWDEEEEDKADEIAFKAVLDASYDVREVPLLYASMQKVATRDARVGLGFLGSRRRIDQRMDKAKDLITNAYKAEIEAKLKNGFLSTSAEHRNLMAELKRDNGIMAYYSDMFELARNNLASAVAIRDNDPEAHYYYAKVLKLTAHTPEDEKLSRDEFYKAEKFDTRDEYYGSHLHLALLMARDRAADKDLITKELDSYVSDYARWMVKDGLLRAFPPNLDTIYEYMSLFGLPSWEPKPPELGGLQAQYQQINAAAQPGNTAASPGTAAPPAASKTRPGQTPSDQPILPVKNPLPNVIKKRQ